MVFLKNRSIRVLILVLSTLFVFAFIGAQLYYRYENESSDPRVAQAKILYEKYNEFAFNARYDSVFVLMDSIEAIYSLVSHYEKSYEVGVLYNNRGAAYIAMSLDTAITDSLVKDSLLNLAQVNLKSSIDIYENWLEKWQQFDMEEIRAELKQHFPEDDPTFLGKSAQRYINKRAKEIREAKQETPRRLSVTYTNLGLTYRHKGMYDLAIDNYMKALELWPDNLTAENNINILFGREPKKKSFIRQLFPKDRITR
jgi:tetratricopeptide (TPR) repeat protein